MYIQDIKKKGKCWEIAEICNFLFMVWNSASAFFYMLSATKHTIIWLWK